MLTPEMIPKFFCTLAKLSLSPAKNAIVVIALANDITVSATKMTCIKNDQDVDDEPLVPALLTPTPLFSIILYPTPILFC